MCLMNKDTPNLGERSFLQYLPHKLFPHSTLQGPREDSTGKEVILLHIKKNTWAFEQK